jgi:hypothetical protein
MANLNYEQFKKETALSIKNHLSEEYQDYNLKFQMIQKSGYEYEALLIEPKEKKGVNAIPVLNITDAFRQYEEGASFLDIMDKLADIRMNAKIPTFNERDMFDFDKIKNRIMPRLINTAWNEAYLEGKPHTDIEDLSVMYVVRINEDKTGIADAVISNELLNIWDKTVQDLHDVAMNNIAEQKALFCNLAAYMDFLSEKAYIDIDDVDPDDYDMPFFILTNKQKTNGAIMAANPAVMDKITDKFGKLYIIPSSTEEVIIVPQTAVDDVHGLAKMVKQVNENEVRPEDQLSNNVYEYDIDSHSLKIAV